MHYAFMRLRELPGAALNERPPVQPDRKGLVGIEQKQITQTGPARW
jgi:hypothetical protein